jgi:polyhydroxyalkanoate synthesis regulator phasin
MNEAIQITMSREERPPFVKFERCPVEDVAASRREGRYIARDVDFALVTQPYSRDVFRCEVEEWFKSLDRELAAGRMRPDWIEMFKRKYEAWRKGQEMPIEGTPIRGWGVISPAQQEMLIHLGIMTVEDLAAVNDEGMRRIGIGAVELKTKAKAWIAQLRDKGPLTMHVTALEKENARLKETVAALETEVAKLRASFSQIAGQIAPQQQIQSEEKKEVEIALKEII